VLDDEMLTIEDLAAYLKLRPQTIYKWAQTGKIPGAKFGKEWRFRRSTIERWIDSYIPAHVETGPYGSDGGAASGTARRASRKPGARSSGKEEVAGEPPRSEHQDSRTSPESRGDPGETSPETAAGEEKNGASGTGRMAERKRVSNKSHGADGSTAEDSLDSEESTRKSPPRRSPSPSGKSTGSRRVSRPGQKSRGPDSN
jgi:excisionase family DNA binding protein